MDRYKAQPDIQDGELISVPLSNEEALQIGRRRARLKVKDRDNKALIAFIAGMVAAVVTYVYYHNVVVAIGIVAAGYIFYLLYAWLTNRRVERQAREFVDEIKTLNGIY